MPAQITVRIPDALREELDAAATRERRKPSELVRVAIRMYLDAATAGGRRPAECVSDLLGSLESGEPDLAARHREVVLEAIRRGS